MNNRLFKNDQLQAQFTREGYIVIPMLTNIEVASLHKVYQQHFKKDFQGLQSGYSLELAPDLNRTISAAIIEVFQASFDRVFYNYDCYSANFMVKSINTGEHGIHQDWGIVDETQYESLQMWCPLVDTDIDSGAMFVLPRSHQYFYNLRSGSTGMPYMETPDEFWPYIKALPMKAGEALLYNNATFHGSFPNEKTDFRITAMCGIFPKKAPLTYYQKNDATGLIDVYHMDINCLLEEIGPLDAGEPPKRAKLAYSFDYKGLRTKDVTKAFLLEKMQQAMPEIAAKQMQKAKQQAAAVLKKELNEQTQRSQSSKEAGGIKGVFRSFLKKIGV